jgi:hypothetical protein
MKTDKKTILLAALALIAGTAIAGASVRADDANSTTIEQHSMQVMPFDMNKTTHIFLKTSSGGVETIVVKDPSDTADIALIRSHLEKESKLFAVGNFSDPAYIHGSDMPGLQALSAGATRPEVRYGAIPAGAQIAFTTQDASLVSAVHAWFDAQVKDHGAHAMMAPSPAPSGTDQMHSGMSHMRMGAMPVGMSQMHGNMGQMTRGAMTSGPMMGAMASCPMHQSMGTK